MKSAATLALVGAAASSLAYTVDPPSKAASDTIESCTYWVIARDSSTCQGISDAYYVDLDNFQTVFNPSVGKDCNLVSGNSYCVEADYDPPNDGGSGGGDATTSATPTGNGISTPSPHQTGLPKNCDKFYKVQKGDGCGAIASDHGISLDQFYKWNPTVGDDCSGLWADYYVCVSTVGSTAVTTTKDSTPTNGIATPTPHQEGLAKNCNKFYKVEAGDSCAAIASDKGISTSSLYKWNSAVGDDCSGLWAGYYICVGVTGYTPTLTTSVKTTAANGITTPTPHQAGFPKNCDKFHKVKSGDNCAAIAKEWGVSLDTFYGWNPAVGTDCSGLWAEYYYCVHTVGYKPTPVDSGNGISTPTPYLPDSTDNCRTFHKVVKGDNCAKLAKEAGVSLDQFVRWNPHVGSNCAGLWAQYYVCFATL